MLLALLLIPTFSRADGTLSPEAACSQITLAIGPLAHAEREAASALRMLSIGGDLVPVEKQLNLVLEDSRRLRAVLRRVRLDNVAREPSVADCLTIGYNALFDAERLSADIERVILDRRSIGRLDSDCEMTPQPSSERPNISCTSDNSS